GVTAESAAKVEERIAALSRSLSPRKIQNDLVNRVAGAGRTQTAGTFTVLAERTMVNLNGRAEYRSLVEDGTPAVLEISVVELSLRGHTGEVDPSLNLAMTVRTRLLRTADDTELYTNSLTYSGGRGGTLAEWTGDAELMRVELHRATEVVA